MKVLKALKKLKFWSRKNTKKKTKTYFIEHHHQPPPPCHCHYSWFPVEPSAPPLPASAPAAWFEYEQTHNTLSASAVVSSSSSQAGFATQEIVPEFNYPEKLANNASYQQYMDPNPVYGVPILPSIRREKSAGIFGFVVNFGRHFFRCLCPCFHIREVD